MSADTALEVVEASSQPKEKMQAVFARFGSFALISNEPFERPRTAIVEALIRALRDDTRVVSVAGDTYLDEDWCQPGPFFPSPPEGNEALGRNPWLALEFSDAIRFKVEVPAKNQRHFMEGDYIPTKYSVWWNGVVALVSWKMDSGDLPGMAGGHVVEEIIEQAAQKAGYQLYVQGCNPTCTYRFAHATLCVREGNEAQAAIEYGSGDRIPNQVIASLPPEMMDEPAMALYRDLAMPMILFTRVKNLGRRVLDIEEAAREDLDRLLSLNNRAAEAALLRFRDKPRRLLQMWGWRKYGKRLIARLWLELASIERVRRTWGEQNFNFDCCLARGMEYLFAGDSNNDADRIQSLDLDPLRAAVEHTAQRQDNRALVVVTAIGAIAGALAGAIVSGILAA